jgi:hypothetical protein
MTNEPGETERSNVVAIRPPKAAPVDVPEAAIRSAGAHAAQRSHPSVDTALATLADDRPAPARLSAVSAMRPMPALRLRIALGIAAAGQLIVGVAWLANDVPFGRFVGSPTAAHLSRDAALGVVLGIIGMIVAWRPRWSVSLLPVVGAIVAVQTLGLLVDARGDEQGFHFELPHVLALAVGALIFFTSRRRRLAVA